MLKFTAALFLVCIAYSAEPIAGQWRLKSQQVNGRETRSAPLTLRIAQTDNTLRFEYAAADFSLRFAATLDGKPAEVSNSNGKKLGTARVTRGAPSQYFVTLEGPNRPTSNGKLTLSNGGKTLTSEADALAPGGQRVHTVQVFERQ